MSTLNDRLRLTHWNGSSSPVAKIVARYSWKKVSNFLSWAKLNIIKDLLGTTLRDQYARMDIMQDWDGAASFQFPTAPKRCFCVFCDAFLLGRPPNSTIRNAKYHCHLPGTKQQQETEEFFRSYLLHRTSISFTFISSFSQYNTIRYFIIGLSI